MKNLFRMSAVALIALSVASCEEVKDVTTIEGLQGEATIRGHVLVDSDQTTGDTDYEPAAGAAIRVTYLSKSLSYTSSPGTPNYPISIVTVANADGAFEVVVPTINQGVSFTIEALEFQTTLTTDAGDTTAIFAGTLDAVTLRIGDSRFVELNYGDDPIFRLP